MQSDAKTVTEYLLEVPEERLATLKKLRALCRKHLKGFKESMEYGMPSYWRPCWKGLFTLRFLLRANRGRATIPPSSQAGYPKTLGGVKYLTPSAATACLDARD